MCDQLSPEALFLLRSRPLDPQLARQRPWMPLKNGKLFIPQIELLIFPPKLPLIHSLFPVFWNPFVLFQLEIWGRIRLLCLPHMGLQPVSELGGLYVSYVFFFSFLKYIFYWCIVHLQCFRCTARWFSYTHTHIIFQIILHYRLLLDTDYRSLFYTVNHCCLLNIYFFKLEI